MPCCQFHARATAAQAGDTLRFVNRSPVPHNVHYQGVGEGDHFNVMVPAGSSFDAPAALAARRGPSAFRDAVHPWMSGVVWAFDHPYFAVADAKGRFVLRRVPVGRWRLVCWHESGGYRDGRGGEALDVTDAGGVVALDFDVTPKGR